MRNLYMMLLAGLLWGLQTQAQSPVVFTKRVATGNDDAEQRVSTGAMDLTSSDLEIMTDGSNNQLIGIRFTGITLPQGITIDSAFIQFANKGDKAPVLGDATIRGQLIANAATFASTANNISTRITTTASVVWPGSTDATWSTANVNFAGPLQRTPDIKSVLQEIVNQGTWADGNALAIIMNGAGVRNTQSYNGSSTLAPQLIIHYKSNSFAPNSFPLAKGATWRYFDNGTLPAADWAAPAFADQGWAFGNAKLGYGDPVTTTVSFGGNAASKHITTYLRAPISVTNTALYDSLIFKVLRDDGCVVYINGVEAFRSNMPGGSITNSTLASTDVTGADEKTYVEVRVPNTFSNGTNVVAVELHQYSASSDDLAFDMEIVGKKAPLPIGNLPINKNSSWYYLDNGTDQGTAWKEPAFDNSSWESGPGKLGYSDNPATLLSFGPNANNKYITYYFRKQFNVASVAALAGTLTLNLLRDDGAIVYINGVEVVRDNMPAGPITYLTFSSSIIDGAAESTYYEFSIPKSVLVDGLNTIAVEVHQRDGTSSDLGFDLELKENTTVLKLLNPAPGSSVSAGSNYNITWTSLPSIANVNLSLSTDNGATFTSIANNVVAATQSYSWAVPNINASSCFIRIADAANNAVSDTTDASFWIYPTPVPFNPCADPEHIGCFTSVQPMAQTQIMRLPEASHGFQRIAKTGDALTFGGTMGGSNDFTGFSPKNLTSSTEGALGVNHETNPGGVSVFYIKYNPASKIWGQDSSGAVDFAAPNLVKTERNCSGGLTPWGTIVTCEETFTAGDANGDGYEDVGWNVEYNPWTRQVADYDNDGTKDKLWAMGRMSHENVVFMQDSLTAYFGEDGGSQGVYKFVANEKTKFNAGTLYVMKRTGSTGTWITVPNTTQAQRNTVSTAIVALGGTNFNGVEDIEINPLNGMIYFASKGNGIIYRFTDNGTTVSNFEDYVGNSAVSYNINYGTGNANETWGSGIDNLAFDDKGNLWAHQDGGRNHFWVIRPDHTPASPKVDLFATTPAGSEPTGLTFSPDFKFGFMSLQHPSTSNSTAVTDAAGASVIMNTHTTIVFARKNNLGAGTLTVNFGDFWLRKIDQTTVGLNWETLAEDNSNYFEVERAMDGVNFIKIATVPAKRYSNTKQLYTFDNKNVPAGTLYYRIKYTSKTGKITYTDVKFVQIGAGSFAFGSVYPNPFKDDIRIVVNLLTADRVSFQLTDVNGRSILTQQQWLSAGVNNTVVKLSNLASGTYFLTMASSTEKKVVQITK